jgi:hypothetical protein
MTVWDLYALAQESQTRLAHGLFEATLSYLRGKAEHTLNVSEELVEQVRRGKQARKDLARGSANTYAEFLDALFLYYRESTRFTESKPAEVLRSRPTSSNR